MQYAKEFDIRTFDFWSGAAQRVEDMPSEELDACQDWLESCFEGSTPTETEVNDAVWFDWDDERKEYGFTE